MCVSYLQDCHLPAEPEQYHVQFLLLVRQPLFDRAALLLTQTSWVLPPLSVGKMALRLYGALNYSHGLSKGPSFGTGREAPCALTEVTGRWLGTEADSPCLDDSSRDDGRSSILTRRARTGAQADLRRRRISVSSWYAWRERTRCGDIRACEVHSGTSNTDTKLLIYGLFQKGRVLAQDAIQAFRLRDA